MIVRSLDNIPCLFHELCERGGKSIVQYVSILLSVTRHLFGVFSALAPNL